jgi:hypothetical protein
MNEEKAIEILRRVCTVIDGRTYYVFTEQDLRNYLSLSLKETLDKL